MTNCYYEVAEFFARLAAKAKDHKVRESFEAVARRYQDLGAKHLGPAESASMIDRSVDSEAKVKTLIRERQEPSDSPSA